MKYPGASGFGGVPPTFDTPSKRESYAVLDRQGTLRMSGDVQVLDFTIVIGALLVFTALALLGRRMAEWHPVLRRLGTATIIVLVLAPVMDAAENITAMMLIGALSCPITSDGIVS